MNRTEIHEWLDNFHNKTLPSLPNKKYNIRDLLKLMPEPCGREYVRLGNETFGLGKALPDYDQIMNNEK